jgi:lipid-A-disaccharide synthase
MTARSLLVVAGESSGDQRAARLIEQLLRRRPEIEPFGMGGDEMRRLGVEMLVDSQSISVVGIVEALRILPRARAAFRRLLAEVDRRGCDRAVLVDFPEFNLRLAKALRRRGVRVLYYVSPQVWAWRRRRVRLIRRVVDRMLVLFPFEVDFYRDHGIAAECVGHPLVDEVPELPQAWEREDCAPPLYRLAILPGSRRSEVEALLPVQLAAATVIAARVPAEVRVILAPGLERSLLERHLEAASVPATIVSDNRHVEIAGSHLVLCASGTATLETGLLGTPMVVVYRMTAWTYRVARRLVRLPYISLVNLVLQEGVVPELIQDDATPERIAATGLELLLETERRVTMQTKLAALRARLGESGASARAAAAVDAWLGERAA